ncbi:MAG: IS3 family transposase [Flavobacteriales bacterium]|nr:IS3 family transposase [Flavobacteriales bacterium]
MKDSYPHISLVRLCRSFGVTRQAFYQHFWTTQAYCMEHELVLVRVQEIRQDHRRLGTRKLMDKLQPFLLEHHIKMGRDALFDLLADHGLLVRRLRKYIHTTRSSHWLRKWPNLIKDRKLTGPGQLWVSDITYFKTGKEGYTYISLITDAWSHRIMGHHLATDLEAASTLEALRMAIAQAVTVPKGLIHHSDRGVQYCSQAYVDVLQANSIGISMTEKGDPLENAVAERINGIIKQEYLDTWCIDTVAQARAALERAVFLYNSDRPHNSISNLTPDQAHTGTMKIKRLWKNYYPKRTPVNAVQDVLSTVNLSSDINQNL